MTPLEDIEHVIKSIMEFEQLPRIAAIAGAQRYALDTANDLDERAWFEKNHCRFMESDKLFGLAKEYRQLGYSE